MGNRQENRQGDGGADRATAELTGRQGRRWGDRGGDGVTGPRGDGGGDGVTEEAWQTGAK